MSEYISAPIYQPCIRAGVAIEEAQANKADIFGYAGKSAAAEDCRAVIAEFLKRVESEWQGKRR